MHATVPHRDAAGFGSEQPVHEGADGVDVEGAVALDGLHRGRERQQMDNVSAKNRAKNREKSLSNKYSK